ncbi:MAG: (d)CMP kinase [Candidatus Hydrogenedentes bacterium]|nr:(d)CMP kinase [Candidatus Hydrogenedentota bacterium]
MSDATQIVAIDGPAGAGKSTTAKAVARILGFAFLDTGAMYRAATWWALDQGVDLDDPAAIAAHTARMNLEMAETDNGQIVRVNGADVSDAIRSPEITRLIYKLDQNSEVRAQLVALQRRFGEQQPTVAEGRDIGTVVFPRARCKIFLDASLDTRTERRARQLEEKGLAADREKLRAELNERDEQSRNRADSPLRQADDAIRVDTTSMTFDEAVDAIAALARKAL